MMTQYDRLTAFVVGLLLGLALGYITRTLTELKEQVNEVDEIVKNQKQEDGFVRYPYVADVALILVVVLTVWAAFASQKASNEVEATQERLANVTMCNEQYLAKTIEALNERTTYTGAQAQANVALQEAQTEYLRVVLEEPPSTDDARGEALKLYFEKLTAFIEVVTEQGDTADSNPYPTTEELNNCLEQ